MSILVFAEGAQFSTVAALSAGAGPWVAAVTAVTVNLRLLPLGLAASSGLSSRRGVRALQCLTITDESVAIASRADGSIDGHRLVWSGVAVATAWVAGTALGAVGAAVVADPRSFGLDAAFPAGFIALLAPRLRHDRKAAAIALGGAVIALALVPVVAVGVPSMAAAAAALLAVRK